jgi:hypothetical protein
VPLVPPLPLVVPLPLMPPVFMRPAAPFLPAIPVPAPEPLVALARAPRRERLVRIGATLGAVALVLAPWCGWNLVRFHQPELLSTGFGTAVYAGSCDPAFRGPLIGYWGGLACTLDQRTVPAPDLATAKRWRDDPQGTAVERMAYLHKYLLLDVDAQGRLRDESDLDVASRHAALDYLDAHRGRVPIVIAARLGRIWNLYRPGQGIRLDADTDGRGTAGARLAFAGYLIVMPLAIAGLVVMRRRRHPIWPYLMLAVEVSVAVTLTYGIQRFRIPVDTVAPVLGAVAFDAAWPRVRAQS